MQVAEDFQAISRFLETNQNCFLFLFSINSIIWSANEGVDGNIEVRKGLWQDYVFSIVIMRVDFPFYISALEIYEDIVY